MPESFPIGLVAPLPPQTGGVASFARWLLDNERAIGCSYRTFDLRRPAESEAGGRLRIDAVLRQAILLLQFARWLRSAPRVVHYCVALTATGLPRDLLFVALLRSARRRTIAHVHGPAFEGGRSSAAKSLLLRGLGRFSAARVAVMPMEGWDFVPNPLRLAPDGRAAEKQTSPVRLLAVGWFGAMKGSDTLIDAVAGVRQAGVDASLRFVGRELRRREEQALRRLVRERGLDRSVEFAGVLPPDRLRSEYRRAHIFCLPSRREGLPMALLEAMAFDVPAVATPVGAIPAFIDDGHTGLLVEPGNTEKLAEAIERLATDPDLRRRLGEAGGERVRAMCAADKIADRWRRLYAELALESRAR